MEYTAPTQARGGKARRREAAAESAGGIARPALWLSLIVVLAVLLRVGFLMQYMQRYSQHALGIQPFLFEPGNIAYSLVQGGGFASPFRVPTGPTAWMPPVYPFILAGIFRLFGAYTFAAFLAAVSLNIAFISVATVPVFWAAREIAGTKLALGAALLWAVFPNGILLPVESLWDASLCALLVALILWWTLRLAREPSALAWACYGLLWGVTLMTNPAPAIVLPVLLVWLVWRTRRARVVQGIALFAGVALLCCIPWTIRNYEVFHAFIPVRSVFGLPLWLGNNPQYQPRWRGQGHPLVDQSEREEYIRVGELAYMREKRDAAIAYMLENPRRDVEMAGRRFLAFWCGGTPYPVDDFMQQQSLQFRYILLFNIGVTIGTLAGAILLFRERSPYRWILAVFPLVFPFIYYVTTVVPRYRLPIDPVLMILTAIALSHVPLRRAHAVPAGK